MYRVGMRRHDKDNESESDGTRERYCSWAIKKD